MKQAKISILDCGALSRLCMGSGRARAMQELTKTSWQPDKLDDDAFMRALYSIFSFKTKPGTVRVDTDMKQVAKRGQEYAYHYQEVFYRKLLESPRNASEYAESIHRRRCESEEFLQQQFADARQLNREIENEWTKHIIGLKTVQTASEIVVSMYAPGVAVLQGAVIMGFELIPAKTMSEAGIVCAKYATKEGLQKLAESTLDNAMKSAHDTGANAWEAAMDSNKKAEQIAKRMASKRSSSKLAKLGRGLDRAKFAAVANTRLSNTALRSSKRIHLGKKYGLPVLFAIPDLIEIYDEIESLH